MLPSTICRREQATDDRISPDQLRPDLWPNHPPTPPGQATDPTRPGLKADFTYISKIENDRLEVLPSEALIRGFAQILETDAEAFLELAGKFDQKALQAVVAEIPEAGILLRRLQARKISQKQLRDFLEETGG